MKAANGWPRTVTTWIENRTLNVSIPFTWLLAQVAQQVQQRSILWDKVRVGGPAIYLQPGYFSGIAWVEEGAHADNVLQRINPDATRTTRGCPNRCQFCAVPILEPGYEQFLDWPDLPVIVDDNPLAASQPHLDRVFDRLETWGWADFNQGLDAAKLTHYHAERLKRIGRPIVRLALDHANDRDQWERAYTLLRKHAIPKHLIRSYALIAFDTGPDEAWDRCKWIEDHGVKALPMWFHELDATEPNTVTDKQRALGWTDYERRRIMQWFYQHKRAAKPDPQGGTP